MKDDELWEELDNLANQYKFDPNVRKQQFAESILRLLKCLLYSVLAGQVIGALFIVGTSPDEIPFSRAYFDPFFQTIFLSLSMLLLPVYLYLYRREKLWYRLAMQQLRLNGRSQ